MRLSSCLYSRWHTDFDRGRSRKTRRHEISRGLVYGTLIVFGLMTAPMVFAQLSGEPQELPKPKIKTTPPLFQEWNFSKDQADANPTGFSSDTIGKGEKGAWTVNPEPSAPSRPNVLMQKPGCQDGSCYHVLLADGSEVEYLDLSVRLKLILGSSTGKGGVVFGAQDSRNFYAVVVTPETNTLEGVLVKDGQVTSLGKETVKPAENEWHSLRVHRKSMISHDPVAVHFDKHRILSFSDSTFGEGKVGLITFGQGAFAFDNLSAVELLTERPLSRPAAY